MSSRRHPETNALTSFAFASSPAQPTDADKAQAQERQAARLGDRVEVVAERLELGNVAGQTTDALWED
jgi:hypothetical protein